MSHVAKITLRVKSLEHLAAAAKECGLELRIGQTRYKWWGTSVGDYPLPEGFTKEDLGKCEHALVIPDPARPGATLKNTWEIGVVPCKDGGEGYVLLWDFYSGGHGLVQRVGDSKASKLVQAYAKEVALAEAKKLGHKLKGVTMLENGTLQVKTVKYA